MKAKIPTLKEIIADPNGAALPLDANTLGAVCTRLAASITRDNTIPIVTYLKRLPANRKKFILRVVQASMTHKARRGEVWGNSKGAHYRFGDDGEPEPKGTPEAAIEDLLNDAWEVLRGLKINRRRKPIILVDEWEYPRP